MSAARARWLRAVAWARVAVLLAAVIGCGGGAGKPGGRQSNVVLAKDAEIGKTVTSKGYELTLIDPPEKSKLVGGAVEGGGIALSEGHKSVRTAQGMWLVLPVKLTNKTGDVAMLPRDVFIVRDAQGREYKRGGRLEHLGKVFDDSRWKSDRNYLVDNPMDAGGTREGPLIFDVAEDATGLKLISTETGEAINLGF